MISSSNSKFDISAIFSSMHFEIGLDVCFVQNNAIFYIGIFSELRVYTLGCRKDEITAKPNTQVVRLVAKTSIHD